MASRTAFAGNKATVMVTAVVFISLGISSAVPIYDVANNKWHTAEIVKALTTNPENDLPYGQWEGATVKLVASSEGITERLETEYELYHGKGSTEILIPNVSFEIHGEISTSHKVSTRIYGKSKTECSLAGDKKKYEEGPTKGTLSIYFHNLNTNAALCGLKGQPKLDAASTQAWITKCKAREDYLTGAMIHLVYTLCMENVIKPYNEAATKRQKQ